MSDFPNSLDTDESLPIVNDNINEIGGEAINALRDAVFAIEQNIGLSAQGTTASISERFGVSFFADGNLKPSVITGLGLVTLPITGDQIASFAEIAESKLNLDHKTQDLFNYIRDLSGDINVAMGWISATGVKLEPHIAGSIFKHSLSHINVSSATPDYLLNNLGLLRNNTNSYLLINDINNEFLAHQFADGSPLVGTELITTNDGSTYPDNYGHTAAGIFLNTSRFSTIPQTTEDVQAFADFIDSASIFLLGTRLQNLYSNGISKESRSSSLITDGYGPAIITTTAAIAYFKNIGTSSSPYDDINTGDDIIEFMPPTGELTNNSFDAKFALVRIGDIIRVNYGTVEIAFLIKEKKYIQNGGNKKFIIRIAGKNLQYAPNATARIDKTLVNNNKYGVLAIAAANSNISNIPSSLIMANPRCAQALGIGFNPDQFDATHYVLYLALYPTGNPSDGYIILPGIDITGNQGATPGAYTLSSIIEATNNAFRRPGYNYRFIAFKYKGEFGIALADSYNNVGFSILNAVVLPTGGFDSLGTTVAFPNNVIGIFSSGGLTAPDPLGFGVSGSNIASPAYETSYASPEASQTPTKLFLPLKRNNYYVNGTERDKLNIDVGQVVDGYGDGYWFGTVTAQTVIPGVPGAVQTTYRVPLDLAASQLKKGKTLVVQSLNGSGTSPNDFGRFIISDISLGCCSPSDFTDIQVYDSIHGLGLSGSSGLALGIGEAVRIYFSSDSVAFNNESATDFTSSSPFKRHFEIYVDENSNTFTHERGRFYTGAVDPFLINEGVELTNYSELVKINIIKISSKLRGYQFGSVNKITLNISNFDNATGVFDGYLSYWDGTNPVTNLGPVTTGKKGETVRFYDETNIDYIDIIFNINTTVTSFSNKKLDIQLFPTLSLDNQIMLLGTFQFYDINNVIEYITDERQFGNISEKELSTSALNFITLSERLLHGNGVIRGFDLDTSVANPNNNQIYLTGGEALVNGNFIQFNNDTVTIPTLKEAGLYNINWALCINSIGEYQPIPLLDYDAVLATPTNPIRMFSAFNLVNGQTYNLEASTFSNIINNRKDLTPLYIIASTTAAGSPPTISLSVSDVRKFINDGDTNLPLKFTSSVAQGNFRSIHSIFNWIKYNNSFNGTAIVKGANTSNAVINIPMEFHFDSTVVIDGQNNAEITFNSTFTVGSNLTIKNLTLNCNAGIFAKAVVIENLIFDNCVINITIPVTFGATISNQVVLNFINSQNIIFKDCTIILDYDYGIIEITDLANITQYPTLFRFNNTSEIIIDNCFMTLNYNNVVPGTTAPGGAIVLINSSSTIIKNSDFIGNMNRVVAIDNSNNLKIIDSVITSTYNPSLDFNIGFGITPLNSGHGYIYSNVNATLENIIIENVIFNYSPIISALTRFSFINFELSNNTSILSNLTINNCKFNSTNSSGNYGDIRAAIAIINTYSANNPPILSSAQQPILLNAKIIGNTCNNNQSIIITSRLDGDEKMNYPGLAAQNCTIRDNICGTIGYWIAASTKVISPTLDKMSGLIIENNNCHYISNLNSEGNYFLVRNIVSSISANMSYYPSGHVIINNNKCNWIHTGIAFEEDSTLTISNNHLIAYNIEYLDLFNNDGSGALGNYGFLCAIVVNSNIYVQTPLSSPSEGNNSSVRIVGNTTNKGYWYTSGGIINNYTYSNNYITCLSSSNILDNVLDGIGTDASDLIMVNGKSNIIKGNKIYRRTNNIDSYIRFGNFQTPSWDGSTSTGIIVDNFFDSPYINSSGEDQDHSVDFDNGAIEMTIVGQKGWTIERNKNQTGYAIIPLTNHLSSAWGFNDDATAQLNLEKAEDYIDGYGKGRSNVIRVRDSSAFAFREWTFQENIEKYLPNGVRLIQLTAGIRSFGSTVVYSGTPLTTSNFTIHVSRSNINSINVVNLDYFSVISSFDTAITETTSVNSFITGAVFNSTSANIPFNINFENYAGSDISYNYITGRGTGLTLAADFRWEMATGAGFLISPVLIKYRW